MMFISRFSVVWVICAIGVAAGSSSAQVPSRGDRALSSEGWRGEAPDDPPGRGSPAGPRGPGGRSDPVVFGEFTSVQVNVDGAGQNILGDAANEPSITVDPTSPNTMAIGWREFEDVASNFRQAGNAHTSDGGLTWTFPGPLDPGQFRSDPVLASDAAGNFYYSSLSSLSSIEVFKSTDGGVTWPSLVPAFGGDKQWIAVDRTAGTGAGNLYQIWNVQFSCCGNNDFTRSIDGAASFESPVAVTLPSMKWGTMDVGPDGTLYLAGATLSASGHLFTKSTNAQDPAQTPTFDTPLTISLGGNTATGGVNPAGLLGQVWIATDHSNGPYHGNVYVLGSVNPLGGDPLDVMFIRSEDGGDSWSAPVRVNDDVSGLGGAWQWFGTMAVAPNGRIDVVWNDTRAFPAANESQLYYAYSLDAGLTWRANIPLSPPFDQSLGYPNQNKLGDYYDMISEDAGANLAYAATFNDEQDVWFLRIAPDCNGNGIHDGTDVLTGFSTDCNGNGIADDCEFAEGCLGILPADMNCDLRVDGDDIAVFVDYFLQGRYTCQADLNPDGVLDTLDTPGFVQALLSAP
jgi:hypothetical protein